METPSLAEGGGPSNQLHGNADAVVQARDINGSVHITVPATPRQLVPRELPPDIYAFVGREEQIWELDRLLERPDASTAVISAVSGTAGVGKTALAIHWAHLVRDRFPDGDLYVDLQGFSLSQPVETTDVLAGFLRSLGVATDAIPVTAYERAARYRSVLAGRRMLIVLDNARTADQVRPLLPGSGSCLVLVTSRDRLSDLCVAEGAQRVDLDVLSPHESIKLLRAMLSDRVVEEPAAAVELCEWAAQLPLALRIIGMRAHGRPHASLGELARELSNEHQRLDVLEAAPSERWSVRVVFSWSYRHLTDDVARCFRLVACFPGRDFSLATIAELVDRPGPVTLRLVEDLLRTNLVEYATDGRLRMHDLLRTYAASLADEDETRRALTRLLRYYLRQATSTAGRAWLAEELSNLVAGFELAAQRGWDQYTNQLYEVIYGYLRTAPETRGMVGRPRDIPRMLVELNDRESLFAVDPGRRDRIQLERAEALLHAGLSDEATKSLLSIANTRANRGIGDVQLLHAAAALLDERFVIARRHAKAAERVFEARNDQVRASLAALVRLRAFVADTASRGRNWSMLSQYADDVVMRLTKAGLRNEADIARLLGQRVRIRTHEMANDIESVLLPRHISSVDHLILLRLTRTELEITRGNVQSALEHACRGLEELRRYRSWTSGLELVGGSISYGLELADTTIALVTEHIPTHSGELLDWLEFVRTSVLRYQLPVEDSIADARVAEIRRLTENLELARNVDTTPSGSSSGAALRHATASDIGPMKPPQVGRRALRALGSRVLVNYVITADRLCALVVQDGAYHFTDICELDTAVEWSRRLYVDIEALAPDNLAHSMRQVVEASSRRSAAALDQRLLGPLTDLTAGRELIIVPPTELYRVIWSALPSMTGRAVTVTPSMTTWLAGTAQQSRTGNPLAVIGPAVPALLPEPASYMTAHPDAVVLDGDHATCSAVLSALDNTTFALFITHGTHEPTNAAFSCLELADGALFAHEIHGLRRPPEHVVLAACELALTETKRSVEPLGFAGALLTGGARTVTASLARVGIHSAGTALAEYHQALARGLPPASALATVTAADPFRRPFVCLGWGG